MIRGAIVALVGMLGMAVGYGLNVGAVLLADWLEHFYVEAK